MKNSSFLFMLMFLVSCSNFVNKIHKQIDSEEGLTDSEEDFRGRRQERERDPYANYRHKRFSAVNDKRPVKNPVTYSLGDASGGSARLPPVKRDYRPQRANANDFRDTEDDGSLWANQGSSSSLFTYQNDKHTGDMVIINVLESLRNQISAELKRSFPDKTKRGAKGADAKPAAAATPGAAPAAPGADGEMDMKIYDKISGTVTEEISKDYIVLKGRKEVIFKKEKRSIEVHGLVSRKDIMENDYVNSDKLLESRVYILRANQ